MMHLGSQISLAVFLGLIGGIPLYGALRKVKVYESFIDGAKSAFDIAVKIIPFLVSMLVAIGMLRASGAFELMAQALAPLLKHVGMPPELLPMALVRPFSGSASIGVMAELIHAYGPDSMIARMATTMLGSTETTFYVIAVYFGAIAIKRTRHAIPVGVIADIVGLMATVWVCHLMLG